MKHYRRSQIVEAACIVGVLAGGAHIWRLSLSDGSSVEIPRHSDGRRRPPKAGDFIVRQPHGELTLWTARNFDVVHEEIPMVEA